MCEIWEFRDERLGVGSKCERWETRSEECACWAHLFIYDEIFIINVVE